MVLCAVLLHTGIALCMGLVTFSLMMLVAVLSFIPGSLVRDYLGRLGHFSLLEPSCVSAACSRGSKPTPFAALNGASRLARCP